MNFIKKFLQKETRVVPESKEQAFLTADLNFNANKVKTEFNYPLNQSIKNRSLFIPSLKKEGIIFYLDGAVNFKVIQEQIIKPLLFIKEPPKYNDDLESSLLKNIVTVATVKKVFTFEEVTTFLLDGNTVLFVEGYPHALALETIGFEHRSIEKPSVETFIKGPKEAFVESLEVNVSLIRKQLKDQNLICRGITTGERAKKNITMIYLQNIAKPGLVQNVMERIAEINSDTVLNITILEQHLEERPYSLLPSTLTTERPDRACSFLLEGHIVLLMDNSPEALIVPVTFWSLFQTGEDQYLRWSSGNFTRLIRIIALFIALLTPAVYIAVVTFHVEMLPTDLLLAIAATREKIPFPTLFEILFLELAFEILREAVIRIPNLIGPTIGIVGALILGQAAVEANIVSPILVIIIAITGLASFTIPNLSFNFSIRIFRFLLLFTGAFLGFYGISLTLAFTLAYLVSIKSFEVPFLAPLAPYEPSSKDLIFRPPVWKKWLRPYSTYPQDKIRQKKPEGK